MSELQLPSYASVRETPHTLAGKVSIHIDIDPDLAYPHWMELLGIKESDLNQYWMEVLYACVKLDVQVALLGTEFHPNVARKAAEFKFLNRPRWRIQAFPPSDQRSPDARQHFRKVKGFVP